MAETEPSSRVFTPVTSITPEPEAARRPPAMVSFWRITLEPVPAETVPPALATEPFSTIRPAEPVASTRPALVKVLGLKVRAVAVPVASITPLAWLIRISWPLPMSPLPEMVGRRAFGQVAASGGAQQVEFPRCRKRITPGQAPLT